MKNSADHRSAEKQSSAANKGSGPRGISAPAVPVLQNYGVAQKAEVSEEEPVQTKLLTPQTKFDPTVQLMGTGVVQRIKIGDPWASADSIVAHFPPALAQMVRAALASLGTTQYPSVQAIVDAVAASPDVSAAASAAPAISNVAAIADGAAAATPAAATPVATAAPAGSGAAAPQPAAPRRRRPAGPPETVKIGDAIVNLAPLPRSLADMEAEREAKRAQEVAEQGGGRLIDILKFGIPLTQDDVAGGDLEPIPGRNNGDYQLRILKRYVSADGRGVDVICLHIHPPKLGNPASGGQIMINGAMTQTTTTAEMIRSILESHPVPRDWRPASAAAVGGSGGASSPAAPPAASEAAATSPAAPSAAPAKSTDAWDD